MGADSRGSPTTPPAGGVSPGGGGAPPAADGPDTARVLARTTSTRDMANHLPAALHHDIGTWPAELPAPAFAALPPVPDPSPVAVVDEHDGAEVVEVIEPFGMLDPFSDREGRW
ncbi:hypothetical protein [Nocardia abscessus]|uniref:hypothetical protein n=2 Tax=Nocardia TaxID=1817 RepID=UPI0024580196|nr:hypothetical protein [Nocardia abscessus]